MRPPVALSSPRAQTRTKVSTARVVGRGLRFTVFSREDPKDQPFVGVFTNLRKQFLLNYSGRGSNPRTPARLSILSDCQPIGPTGSWSELVGNSRACTEEKNVFAKQVAASSTNSLYNKVTVPDKDLLVNHTLAKLKEKYHLHESHSSCWKLLQFVSPNRSESLERFSITCRFT